MLRDWLAPLPVEAFIESCLGRAPYARPGAASKALSLCDWDVLSAVLESRPAPDVLVATRGRLVDVPAPKNLSEVALTFARDLHGEVHIQRGHQGLLLK